MIQGNNRGRANCACAHVRVLAYYCGRVTPEEHVYLENYLIGKVGRLDGVQMAFRDAPTSVGVENAPTSILDVGLPDGYESLILLDPYPLMDLWFVFWIWIY